MHYYFIVFEVLSLLVAVLNFRWLRSSNLVWFIPFLFLTNVQEIGSTFGWFTINETNTASQNIFTSIEFLFYSWLFSREIKTPAVQKIVWTLSFLLISATIINLVFFQGLSEFHSYTYLPGSMLMVLFCCLYFYGILHSEQYVEVWKFPMFWISIGVMIFYTGVFCIYAFLSGIQWESVEQFALLFNVLMNIFNIVLYSCIIIAILCQRAGKNLLK